jgi:hypothetical protein
MSPVSTIDGWSQNAEQWGRISQEGRTYQTEIKFQTKTGLAEEGGTTIGSTTNGGVTTGILIFKSKLRYSINELPQLPRARLWSNLKFASGKMHVFLWPRVSWLLGGLLPLQQQTCNHWRDKCCHTRYAT